MRRALLILAALLTAGCSLLPPEAAPPVIDVQAPQVTQREVTPVRRGPIESRQAINVTFGTARQTPVYFRSGGRIRKVHVTPGQTVAPGALLAELEAGSIPYDLQMAEFDLERAKLSIEKARARIGFVDEPSEADLKRLDLDLKAAELRVQRQRDQLADTRLYAPFAGQVISVAAGEGEMATAYEEVLLLAAEGAVVARANADEALAARLRPGQKAEIYPADGNPVPVKGTVRSVPQVGAKDRTLVLEPDQPSDRLRTGRNGKVEIVMEAKADALLVPLSAIRTFGGRKFVTVVEGESRREVAIKTGLESDQYAEVLEGLSEGSQVVSR